MTGKAEKELENKIREIGLTREFGKSVTLFIVSTSIFIGSYLGVRSINNYVDNVKQNNPNIERVEKLDNEISSITNKFEYNPGKMLEEMSMDSTILPGYIGLTNERDTLSSAPDYKNSKRKINVIEVLKTPVDALQYLGAFFGLVGLVVSSVQGPQLLYIIHKNRRREKEETHE